jgi:hypothetical protein
LTFVATSPLAGGIFREFSPAKTGWKANRNRRAAVMRRRQLIKLFGSAAAWPIAARTQQSQQIRLAPDLAARLDDEVRSGRAANIHAVVVVRRSGLACERYYEGTDEIMGRPQPGRISFGPDQIHDLRSAAKSIVGLLYGMRSRAAWSRAPTSRSSLRSRNIAILP